ncbi:hypothetical protein HYC85_010797 [Camellia sinensis]|uniref:Hydroquinone glucosyltransferase n=1 Tax=Camellia sinensis TaxID=4442 RepID=A0A7J7HJ24_CAMSI|nr:hypothetical protein HYC85_010797 [Camellia sinensis]
MNQTPHVAFLPSPGMDHLIPLIEFAKQLVHHHHFSATILIPSAAPPTKAQKTVLQTLPKTIPHIFLPPLQLPIDINNGIPNLPHHDSLSLPSLKSTLSSLTATIHLAALVVDPFGLEAFDVAKEFGLSPYLFFSSTAMVLLFCLNLPKLDETVTGEYRDLPEPIQLPGCVPVHGKDFLDPVQDRSHDSYKELLRNMNFVDLEEGALKALQDEGLGKPPVYPVGPLIQAGSIEGLERSECLQWLDGQPSDSVVFLTFGSGGTLSQDHLNELALGLELSGQRFLWAVRSVGKMSKIEWVPNVFCSGSEEVKCSLSRDKSHGEDS